MGARTGTTNRTIRPLTKALIIAWQRLEGELCRMLHRFHDKPGAHIVEIRLNELLIERIVAWHVRYHRLQQVVDIPSETMYLENAGQLFHDSLKLSRPEGVVLVGLDGNKDH